MPKPTLLRSIAPTIADALNLPIQELAYALLNHLQSMDQSKPIHSGNLFLDLASAYIDLSPQQQEERAWKEAAAEAIGWLESVNFVAAHYESNYTYHSVTRRGRAVGTQDEFNSFVREAQLRKEALHPTIAQNAWPIYIRGKFDTAVFEAFKAVEVSVRKAGKFADTDLGRDLMNKAFNPDNGPLRDDTIPKPEREAIMLLFAGAIGAFKNPNSHRQLDLDDPGKAAQLMMTASNLLSIVDEAVVRNGP